MARTVRLMRRWLSHTWKAWPILLLLWGSACQPVSPPSPAPEVLPSPTKTRTPESTLTAVLSPTLAPVALPSATPRPTATLPNLPKDIFDNFQDLALRCLARTAFGEVPSSGATVEEQVLSDSTIGYLSFTLSWDEGDLDLTLVQPDGSVVGPSLIETDPYNNEYTSKPGYKEYSIGAPQSGMWTARISGNTVPPSGSAYMLEAGVSDALIFSVNLDKEDYYPGDVIKLTASIEDSISDSPRGPEYIYGVVMRVVVEDPASKRYSFELFDDGAHGDGKANDGVYGNAFKDTSVAGIYKIFFQVSGLNNRAGEPFIRECFVAESVDPIPTPIPTGESQVCAGKIEASEPVVIRPEDAGGSDRCDTCRLAFSPKAVSTSAGILVVWQLGFNGELPEPNAFMRLLDDNANPIGDIQLLFERNWVGQLSTLVRKDGGAILYYSGRYSDADEVTSASLDPYGHLISEQRGISYPHLAIGHGRALKVATPITPDNPIQNHLAVHRFDLEGNELGEPVILPPLNYEVNGRIVTGDFNTPFIIPTADGWTILAASRASGRLVALLAPDGSLISGPVIMDTDMEFPNGFDDVIPFGRGAAILGGMFSGGNVVLFISEDGTLNQVWHPEKDEPIASGDLFEYQGRLYLVYTGGPTSRKPMTNQVLIRELKCVP